ncbi:adenosylcobinamide-GDP ribazoletransferase [Pseudomonas sp. PA15(2017)]|uniref:adenosylcobinamide-GDP ribazoletransferase n=1 Tax=Pseudomonas sp. PA15(2017) TaxID=1932111 RepID=UPI00095C6CF2|nr:adenosylcobinamide-GDP ribazoletransferase [Pseudomonas sp. PA15(2017)]OLU26165.1 adenosylcobinamide-GDP ribazoletransferase [Pseudomonas sp. PA15(2017)]
MTPLWIALQFLTRLPVRLAGMPTPQQMGRSLLFYPVVGAVVGGFLLVATRFLDGAPVPLQAALLLTLWVGLSGALHLDGLADSADAWMGGFGDRERTLAIMKDPRSGPIAVVVLVLLLLLKFSALLALLEQGSHLVLLLAPVLGRGALLALFLYTPYVRPGGLGDALKTHLPRSSATVVLVVTALLGLLLGGFWVMVAVAGVFLWLRLMMLQRLGGTTGDTAGALLEVVECAVLLTAALQVS